MLGPPETTNKFNFATKKITNYQKLLLNILALHPKKEKFQNLRILGSVEVSNIHTFLNIIYEQAKGISKSVCVHACVFVCIQYKCLYGTLEQPGLSHAML